MKFKIAVLGLLSAILTICIFTSYILIHETKKQTELSYLSVYMAETNAFYIAQQERLGHIDSNSLEQAAIWVENRINEIYGEK